MVEGGASSSGAASDVRLVPRLPDMMAEVMAGVMVESGVGGGKEKGMMVIGKEMVMPRGRKGGQVG